jgi:actin-related protein 3
MKRGTEDLDFFIGDEALAAANGPGVYKDGKMETAY